MDLYSQSKFLKTNSIGKGEVTKPENKKLYGPVDFREIKEMIGEEFIVIPKRKLLQHYGYQFLYKEQSKGFPDHVTYDEMVGKIIKLVSVDYSNPCIFIDSTGAKFLFTPYIGTFDDLAPLKDLKEASKLFKGRKLWVKRGFLNTYDENTEKVGRVDVLRLSSVLVTDIVVGDEAVEPVRFILKTPFGKVGYIDVNMSGSNESYKYRDDFSFNNWFLTYDPKLKYKYSPAMWKLIQKGYVRLGMTSQQVKLSIGDPDDVNTSMYSSGTHEQWIYGKDSDKTYYYFENGILTAQN